MTAAAPQPSSIPRSTLLFCRQIHVFEGAPSFTQAVAPPHPHSPSLPSPRSHSPIYYVISPPHSLISRGDAPPPGGRLTPEGRERERESLPPPPPPSPLSLTLSLSLSAMPKIDVTKCAMEFRDEIKASIQASVAAGGARPKLVGFLANGDEAASMYARWTERACTRDGITYELRRVERVDLEEAVMEANQDPSVNGILVYYPVFGGPIDDYLRDVISIEKDVEGLNHRYRYSLYHNIRVLADWGNRKAILPCTPLAILKILNFLGAYDHSKPEGDQVLSAPRANGRQDG